MTAIVIDDEPLARSYLVRALSAQHVDVVGEGRTGQDALNLSESLEPEILFLDIQMPDLTGIQAAAALNQMSSPPLLVFVTGFSEHALKAFEYAAFDYLLKPVEPERLAVTLTRARQRISGKHRVTSPQVLAKDLLPAERLPVRTNYAIKLVRIEEIQYAVARDKKVFLRIPDSELKTYYTLVQLEKLLPPDRFVRIHASVIARISLIEALNFLGHHTYSASLADGTVLPVGRTYYQELQRRLGIEGRVSLEH